MQSILQQVNNCISMYSVSTNTTITDIAQSVDCFRLNLIIWAATREETSTYLRWTAREWWQLESGDG